MDFCKKLQELRKQKGLTQEELADKLHVSRTAVSKWESGRGYPSIDSLKALSAFFGITIDSLLSCDEILTIAQEDTRQTKTHFRDLVFGLLDCSTAVFFFLPVFGQRLGGEIRAVSLGSLTAVAPWLKAAYMAVIVGMLAWGVLALALQDCQNAGWQRNRTRISLVWNVAGLLLFIASSQPYGAVLLLAFLSIKVLILTKKQ